MTVQESTDSTTAEPDSSSDAATNTLPLPDPTQALHHNPTLDKRFFKIRRILVILVLLNLGLNLASNLAYYPGDPGAAAAIAFGATVGSFLGVALWAFLAWRFLLGKKRYAGVLTMCVLALLLSGYMAISKLLELRAARQAIPEAVSTMEDFLAGRKIEVRPTGQHQPTNPFQTMVSIGKSTAAKSQAIYAAFDRVIRALQLDSCFNPRLLTNSNFVVGCRQKVKTGKDALDTSRSEVENLASVARAQLLDIDISEAMKKEALASFDRASGSAIANMERFFDLERQILDELDLALSLLISSGDQYSSKGDTLVFFHEGAAEEYNAHLERIRALSKEETSLLEKVAREGAELLQNAPTK